MNKDAVISRIDEYAESLTGMAMALWENPELGYREQYAAKLQADFLKEQGFRVRHGYTVLPTAIVAEYGSGKPVIGVLGEYDALPDLSQDAVPGKKVRIPGGAGHGCGHNMIGIACLGAALAIKDAIDSGAFTGTIRYYGCPAEELLGGKTFMARDGAFEDLDASITWHPSCFNAPWGHSELSVKQVKFRFNGTSAHAAAAPHLGRSALDAVELMNVGVNYLREHVPDDVRIHYAITDGGGVPNTVPSHAEVWYMVRATKHANVADTFERVLKIAKGAAMMTETELAEVKPLGFVYDILVNRTILDIIEKNMFYVGPPAYDDKDRAFAKAIFDDFEPGEQLKCFDTYFIPHEFEGTVLHEDVYPAVGLGGCLPGSTDAGDVSWFAPFSQFGTATWGLGVPLHTWRSSACAGTGIAMHAMINATKVMAGTLFDLFSEPELLKTAKDEFIRESKGERYVSPLSTDALPVF